MTRNVFFENFGHFADAPNGVQKLRELILHLAVRGKLVTQDPTDESAAKLIEQIQAEKARLVKEKRIRKADPLPSVSFDEAPYELPQGWEWVRLAEVGLINPSNYVDSNVDASFVPMASISTKFGTPVKTETKPWSEIKKGFTHFAENDVVLAKITPCFQNGKSAVMSNLANGVGAGTTELHVFRPILETFCPEYVLIYLKTPSFINDGIPKMTGSAGQKRVPKEYFSENPFPLPPVLEQQRIVAKVYQLMALCDELEAKQEKEQQKLNRLNNVAISQLLTSHEQSDFTNSWGLIRNNFDLLYTTPETISKLRKAIFQLAVQGKLVPQDPNDEPASALLARIQTEKERLIKEKKIRKSEQLPPVKSDEAPYKLPHGWEWVRFSDIANIAANLVKTDAYLDYPHVAPDNIEKYTGRLLPYRTVREDGVTSGKHLFFSGQILYSKIRPNLSKVTIVYFDGLCSADMYPIDAYITSRFLMYYMLSATFLDMAVKKDTRVAMPKINQEELNRILVPICPQNEQERIIIKVDHLMALCDDLETRLTKAQIKSEKMTAAAVQVVLAA